MPENIKTKTSAIPDTILIVDDSEINRTVLSNIFEDSYRISEAADGLEALEKIKTEGSRICAVLLDVIMPKPDGMDVLREAEALKLTSRIPVFLITADSGEHITSEAYKLGVMDVINKPIIPYVVERRVGSVIELFMARKRLSKVVEKQQDELSEQEKRIAKLSLGMIEALSSAIEFRSGETSAHTRRIHDITEYMLKHTPLGDNFSDEEIRLISLAAIMHDVGKIAISDSILNKPAKLTPEEFEIMKTHTTQGARLLGNIPQMKESKAYVYACDIALHHHERWDGKGYPEGLKGDEITIWSQIVSLADVYDALVSKRVYKDAFSFEKAVEMIKNGECGVFNPYLLECFFNVENELRSLYC